MLFSDATVHQADVIRFVLDSFCHFSGQKVNSSKSQIFFSPSIPLEVADHICSKIGFNRV